MADVMKAKELVSYQEGSVVSRTLIKKGAGTVTLFAFAAGEGLSEHTAPFDALVHVIEGEAEVSVGEEKRVVSAGEMIILPANEPHALHAERPFKMMLTMVRA